MEARSWVARSFPSRVSRGFDPYRASALPSTSRRTAGAVASRERSRPRRSRSRSGRPATSTACPATPARSRSCSTAAATEPSRRPAPPPPARPRGRRARSSWVRSRRRPRAVLPRLRLARGRSAQRSRCRLRGRCGARGRMWAGRCRREIGHAVSVGRAWGIRLDRGTTCGQKYVRRLRERELHESYLLCDRSRRRKTAAARRGPGGRAMGALPGGERLGPLGRVGIAFIVLALTLRGRVVDGAVGRHRARGGDRLLVAAGVPARAPGSPRRSTRARRAAAAAAALRLRRGRRREVTRRDSSSRSGWTALLAAWFWLIRPDWERIGEILSPAARRWRFAPRAIAQVAAARRCPGRRARLPRQLPHRPPERQPGEARRSSWWPRRCLAAARVLRSSATCGPRSGAAVAVALPRTAARLPSTSGYPRRRSARWLDTRTLASSPARCSSLDLARGDRERAAVTRRGRASRFRARRPSCRCGCAPRRCSRPRSPRVG